jgi:hypothetical protein
VFSILSIILLLSTLVLSYSFSGDRLQSPLPDDSELSQVKIGDKIFTFDPIEVESVRPDLFNSGYFSMFDILVHACMQR